MVTEFRLSFMGGGEYFNTKTKDLYTVDYVFNFYSCFRLIFCYLFFVASTHF